MWRALITVALLAAARMAQETSTTPPTEAVSLSFFVLTQNATVDRQASSFTITDVRPGHGNSSHNATDLPQSHPDSNSNRVKRQERLPTSDMPAGDDNSSSTPTSTSTITMDPSDSSSPNQPSGQESGQQQGQVPEMPSPSTQDPRFAGRRAGNRQSGGATGPSNDRSMQSRGQDQSRSQDRSRGQPDWRDTTRRPAAYAGARGQAAGDSRYPPSQQQWSNDYRTRDRQTQQQSSQNVLLEIEMLRFSNERAVLADTRPCGYSAECSYEITGSLESGDRSRSQPQQTSTIIVTPPKSDFVDILMKTKKTFCTQYLGGQPVILRVDVKTADPARQQRNSRQVRESTTTTAGDDWSTTPTPQEDEVSSTTDTYRPEDDEQNRLPQPNPSVDSEDQYSRDRFGSDQSPQQGRGADVAQYPRPSSDGSIRGGELVNSFECVIDLSNAGYQQMSTAQWKTTSCRPQYPNTQMELMFRYNAYSIDASECYQSRSDEPLSWTPLVLAA